MNWLILFIIAATITTQNIVKKFYTNKKSNVYIFNGITSLGAAIVFLAVSKGQFNFNRSVLPYIVSFTICFLLSAFSSFLAVKFGSLTLTSLITSYSLIIPTLYGLIVLKNPINLFVVLGIMLILISIFLVNFKAETGKISVKWLILVAVAFVTNGLCSTIQNLQQIKFNGEYKTEFMLTVYLCSAVVMFFVSLFTELKEYKGVLSKLTLLPVICGLSNGLTNYFVMVLSVRMPTSVMFPLISAGTIVATAVFSYFFFKERFSKFQTVGIVLGIISIVFLNL